MNTLTSLLLVILLTAGSINCFDPLDYPSSEQVHERYTIYWKVADNNVIHLALQVQTNGWIGFGIGEFTSGSMPGADIVTGFVAFGEGTITDRYSEKYALPVVDTCQDWVLVAFNESAGFTTLEIQRALDTKDAQDRVITPGANKVLIAFGESDTVRLIKEIVFYGTVAPPPPPPSDAMSVEYRMANYSIGNGETHFGCMTFALPNDDKYYIYQIDPLVQPENAAHVHHYNVHICSNVTGGSVDRYVQPGNCRDNPDGGVTGCYGLLFAWAPGAGSAVLPDVAGFPMGTGDGSVRFLVLEIHYDNPGGVGGYRDNSGFRVRYTRQPRKYDAEVLVIGDPLVLLKTATIIPPNAITEYETECPSECTLQLPHEITIFTSGPHMHSVGSQIWTTQWRNGVKINEFGRVDYWSFQQQGGQHPGDRLNTHCVYDSRHLTSPTAFGPASTDEMCMHFMAYYPRVTDPSAFRLCGYSGPNNTLCGPGARLNYPNPSIRDPPGVKTNRTFGKEGSQCQSVSTVSVASVLLISHGFLWTVVGFVVVYLA